jgi:hypothetical protein
LIGAWNIGARVADVPEAVVEAGTGVLLGLLGIFLRDGMN